MMGTAAEFVGRHWTPLTAIEPRTACAYIGSASKMDVTHNTIADRLHRMTMRVEAIEGRLARMQRLLQFYGIDPEGCDDYDEENDLSLNFSVDDSEPGRYKENVKGKETTNDEDAEDPR